MSLRTFFNHRIRGVRSVELWAGGVALVLALGVYLAKTGAGDEGADIARTKVQIADEQRQIRLLKAEVAYLEQPERLQRLSDAYLGLQPLAGTHETVIENLEEVANTRLPAGALKSPVPVLTAETAHAQQQAGAMADAQGVEAAKRAAAGLPPVPAATAAPAPAATTPPVAHAATPVNGVPVR